ncbi:hypothetical protein NXH64_10810 [Butyrivibrio fibrisolvens]|uniref:hypothetical protein n=1 Tax=Pseudobutyrivibrio ruminis TaxID=46206 RepID=UPI00048143E6|nr:hypothetical protein [Pseudobutyrivibrio ruminis]MDC7279989.1 hypothetical protein [Butyrivibrio fibrisolvens]
MTELYVKYCGYDSIVYKCEEAGVVSEEYLEAKAALDNIAIDTPYSSLSDLERAYWVAYYQVWTNPDKSYVEYRRKLNYLDELLEKKAEMDKYLNPGTETASLESVNRQFSLVNRAYGNCTMDGTGTVTVNADSKTFSINWNVEVYEGDTYICTYADSLKDIPVNYVDGKWVISYSGQTFDLNEILSQLQ